MWKINAYLESFTLTSFVNRCLGIDENKAKHISCDLAYPYAYFGYSQFFVMKFAVSGQGDSAYLICSSLGSSNYKCK